MLRDWPYTVAWYPFEREFALRYQRVVVTDRRVPGRASSAWIRRLDSTLIKHLLHLVGMRDISVECQHSCAVPPWRPPPEEVPRISVILRDE
jgi:hypothetical protein